MRDRFAALLKKAHADFKVWLRQSIKTRATKTTRGAGSINALSLLARNELGYDQEHLPQESAPQVEGAKERLRQTLEQLRRNVQQREKKPVTIADLLANEARVEKPEP